LKISDITFTVGRNGCLKIPATVLREMGLGPGSHVRVAYLTEDGLKNTFQEFLLSVDPLDSLSEEQQLRVPDHLLAQANISEDADLQMICLNGCIIICQDAALSTDELSSILESLKTAENISSILPTDIEEMQNNLNEIITEIQEGADSSENLYE
jgi:antitoxin component of MazEF toxin-antitoxin module